MSELNKGNIKRPNMGVEIAGIKLRNPVMPASGTFGYGDFKSQYLDWSALGQSDNS